MNLLIFKLKNVVVKEIILKVSIFIFILSMSLLPQGTDAISPKTPAVAKLEVHFLDVGNGESILIDHGKTEILIDGGFPGSGAAQYIEKFVDGQIEILVASHPHIDHIGGLIEVLETFDVGQIWINGDTFPDRGLPGQIFNKFNQMVKAEGVPVYEARRGETIKADTLTLDILHPDTLIPYDSSAEVNSIMQIGNNNSIVLKLKYGTIAFLLTGDVHVEVESDMLSANLDLKADILKLGHHGSRASSSQQFLKAVDPKVAVYLANKEERRHGPIKPHPYTVSILKNLGIDVYGTDINGTIVVTTDGKNFSINTEK